MNKTLLKRGQTLLSLTSLLGLALALGGCGSNLVSIPIIIENDLDEAIRVTIQVKFDEEFDANWDSPIYLARIPAGGSYRGAFQENRSIEPYSVQMRVRRVVYQDQASSILGGFSRYYVKGRLAKFRIYQGSYGLSSDAEYLDPEN